MCSFFLIEQSGFSECQVNSDFAAESVSSVYKSSSLHKSPVAKFSTGAFSMKDWCADWISDEYDRDEYRSPMLRKSFSVSKNVRAAKLYF